VQALLLKERFFAPASAPKKAFPYAKNRSSKNLRATFAPIVDAHHQGTGS
jgi:hypothetical protein